MTDTFPKWRLIWDRFVLVVVSPNPCNSSRIRSTSLALSLLIILLLWGGWTLGLSFSLPTCKQRQKPVSQLQMMMFFILGLAQWTKDATAIWQGALVEAMDRPPDRFSIVRIPLGFAYPFGGWRNLGTSKHGRARTAHSCPLVGIDPFGTETMAEFYFGRLECMSLHWPVAFARTVVRSTLSIG